MQTSSEHITETSWSRSRSYAGEKQMLPPECPALSSPPVILSPFTCPGNTRWANPSYSLSLGLVTHPSTPDDSAPFITFALARARRNAVTGCRAVACLSPRFRLITPIPWYLAKLPWKGPREEHVRSILHEYSSPSNGISLRGEILSYATDNRHVVYREIDLCETRASIIARRKLSLRNLTRNVFSLRRNAIFAIMTTRVCFHRNRVSTGNGSDQKRFYERRCIQ